MILVRGQMYEFVRYSEYRHPTWSCYFDPCSLARGQKFLCLETVLVANLPSKTYVKIIHPTGKVFTESFYALDELRRLGE